MRPLHACAPLALVLGFVLTPATDLCAQGWSRDCDTPGFGVGGRVFALGTWHNELIAGTYHVVTQDGATLRYVGRFDGVRWRALGDGVSGPVRAIAAFQGDLYIGGQFTVSGTTPVARVARWNGAAWQQVGAGLDGTVWDLCEHQGELYAVGEFGMSGTQPVGQVARFDGTAWRPVGTATYTGLGTPAVYCAVSDGTDLFVGGSFTAIQGVPASHVARWNGTGWQNLAGGVNNFGYGTVRDLAVHQGRLVAAGAFGTAGGVTASDVAAWNGTAWASLGPALSNLTYGSDARSLCVFGGDLYVGGSFNVLGATTPVERIVRYDGTTLLPVGGAVDAEVNPATIFAMVAWNGRLYCGGEFQGVVQPGAPPSPAIACNHIASFDGTAWANLGRFDLGLESDARSLGWWQGRRVVGGRMGYAGAANATGLALSGPEGWLDIGSFDGVVWDIVEHQGDLWVVGDFTRVDGLTVNGVARYDGVQWHALANGPNLYGCYAIAVYQGQVHVGSIGSPQRWTGSAWQSFGTPIYGAILALHVHNGLLYIGGDTPFTTGSPNLFQWDGTTLSIVGGGTNDMVEALGSYGTDLVVGGRFSQAGSVAANLIARWNGTSFQPIGSGITGSTVAGITTFQGELIAGGDLHVNGADYVARFDGAQWHALPGGSPSGFAPGLLADDARGELHVAGWFNAAGGLPAENYAIWHARLPWRDVGLGLASARRPPFLGVASTFAAGEPLHLDVSSLEEGTLFLFVMGTQRVDLPLFGGTLVPSGDMGVYPALADAIGAARFTLAWPALPSGFAMHAQAWCLDTSMPAWLSATNGVSLQQP